MVPAVSFCTHGFGVFREKIFMPLAEKMSVRKLTCFFLLYILCGCLLAYGTASLRIVVLGATLFLTGTVLVTAFRKRFWYAVFLPVLAGILLGCVQSVLVFNWYAGKSAALAETETERTVQAEVMEVVYTNAYSGSYICRITGDGLPFRVILQSDNPSLEEGQVLNGRIRFVNWDETDDGFDEKRYYMGKGVTSAAVDLGLADTGERCFRIRGLLNSWNRYLSDRITAHVRNDGLPLAMLLGNRSALEDSVKRDFRRLGILHLIAVSGTHFSLLTAMAERFLIRLRVRPVHRLWMLAVLAVVYMLLTGMTASVLRAGLMFLLAVFCKAMEMRIRYFTALNLSCGLILLLDPFAVLDAGLHLSYLAVCGCLLFIRLESDWTAYRQMFRPPVRLDESGKRIPPVHGWRRLLSPRYLAKSALSMLLLNLVITCLTLPLSWLYFGEISLFSLLVNLLYIPASGILLFLTVFYLLLYPLGIFILPLASVLSGFTALLEAPAALISSLPHISVSLQYPFIPLFLVPAVLSVCVLPFLRHRLRGIACSLALLLLMTGTIFAYEAVTADQTILIYRNDRLKEGFTIRSGGDILLVDISDGSAGFVNQLLAEAKSLYATEIEGYMLTHFHNRHVGTLQTLSEKWILRTLYLPEPVTEEEQAVYDGLCRVAVQKGIPVVTFTDTLDFGHVTVDLGKRIYLSRSSHPVTGIRISCGGENLVYSSSSFAENDRRVMEWMTEPDIGIFGAHSPVNKKTFALSFAEKPKVLVWNGDSAAFFAGTFPVADRDLADCTRFSFRFPDATGENDERGTAPQ